MTRYDGPKVELCKDCSRSGAGNEVTSGGLPATGTLEPSVLPLVSLRPIVNVPTASSAGMSLAELKNGQPYSADVGPDDGR